MIRNCYKRRSILQICYENWNIIRESHRRILYWQHLCNYLNSIDNVKILFFEIFVKQYYAFLVLWWYIQLQIYQSIPHFDLIPEVKSTEVIFLCTSQEFLNFFSLGPTRRLIFEAHSSLPLINWWITVSMESYWRKDDICLKYSIVYFILHKQTFAEWFSKYLLKNVCRNPMSSKTSFMEKVKLFFSHESRQIKFLKLLEIHQRKSNVYSIIPR